MESPLSLLNSQITFVIQGPYFAQITDNLISSIENYFPGSHIVFSTWANSNFQNRKNVLLVESLDVGSTFRDSKNRILYNLNRQILSTRSGLDRVTTKYAVKVRSDLLFTSNSFLDIFRRYLHLQGPEHYQLQGKIFALNVTTIDPRKNKKMFFHVCDWFYAGFTDDLLKIWSCELVDELSESNYFTEQGKLSLQYPYPTSTVRYHPEAYIWGDFVKRITGLNFEHGMDAGIDNVNETLRSFGQALVICDRHQLGISSQKLKVPLGPLADTIGFNAWRNLHNSFSAQHVSQRLILEEICVSFLKKARPFVNAVGSTNRQIRNIFWG